MGHKLPPEQAPLLDAKHGQGWEWIPSRSSDRVRHGEGPWNAIPDSSNWFWCWLCKGVRSENGRRSGPAGPLRDERWSERGAVQSEDTVRGLDEGTRQGVSGVRL